MRNENGFVDSVLLVRRHAGYGRCIGSTCDWKGAVMKGKVKWFNDSKGYGFIQTEDDREVFVHYTGIHGDGFKTLAEDQEVEFELLEGPKYLQATKVIKKLIR
jgi:cold shock protein